MTSVGRTAMDIEKECSLLGTLFQSIVTDLKSSSPLWDEFVTRGTKLHTLLKATSLAVTAFLESLQKIADSATNTKGSTKDIGSTLTRICVRQKMVESKLKHFTNAMFDQLVAPIQDRMEDWRKVANQLEKDHAKEYKKAMHDIKKRNTDTVRLQKKARKGSKPDIQFQLNAAVHDVNERLAILEESEKSALRNLLVEERTRVCLFANSLAPVLDMQISMMNEMSHMHELSKDVTRLCRNPKQLPTSTDQLVQDFIRSNGNTSPTSPLQDISPLINGGYGSSLGSSPPASPSLSGSRKSSLCSLNSSDSMSSGSLNHNSGSAYHHRYQSFRRANSMGTAGHGSPTSCKSAPAGVTVARLSSVSSHDSGFVSQGIPMSLNPVDPGAPLAGKPPLPLDKNSDSGTDSISPIIRSRPNSTQLPDSVAPSNGSRPLSWKDWSRPGPYDQQQQQAPSSPKQFHNPILPNKHQGPPVVSPKPHATEHHRLSVGEFPSAGHRPPVLRHQSEPQFYPGPKSPARPPKPASFVFPPNVEEAGDDVVDGFPLPPPPEAEVDMGDVTPVAEKPLPPPPPSLLSNGHCPPDPTHVPLPKKEPQLTQPLYGIAPTPIPGDFASMTLGRKNSNHSLQYSSSSGYSSQNTTPACSEDTIASHDTDYGSTNGDDHPSLQNNQHLPPAFPAMDQQMNMYSTMPRSREHHNGNPRTRRPASTAGLSTGTMISTQINNPGTATIRRKPSSKFNSVRRTSNVPKPVQTPTVPPSPVAKLMSTFMAPDQAEIAQQRQQRAASVSAYYYNSNNNNANSNNNNNAIGSLPDMGVPQLITGAARDLTLKFKQQGDTPGITSPTNPTCDVNGVYPRLGGVAPFSIQE